MLLFTDLGYRSVRTYNLFLPAAMLS